MFGPTPGIEAPQQEEFDNQAYSCHNQRGKDGRNVKPDERDEQVLPDGIGDEGPEHIDGAMSKIEDPEHTEDEGETRGDQKEQGAPGDSTHELVKKDVKGHSQNLNDKCQSSNAK